MNHDEIAELLGAYALDAVDDGERTVIETHLAVCPRCRAEVHEHREVATLLAHGGGDAPDGIWQRIAGSLGEAPPRLRLAPVADKSPSEPRRRPSRIPYLLAGAAAAAVVLIALLGVQVSRQDGPTQAPETALEDPLSPAFQSALTEPGSEGFELRSADGNLTVEGAVTDEGVAFLQASQLPTLEAGRTYQLWGAADDELVSLGVLGASPRTVTFPADPYTGFAITEEQAPGVVVSANAPVVSGELA